MAVRVPVLADEGRSELTPVLAGETLAGDMPMLTPYIPLPPARPDHARSAGTGSTAGTADRDASIAIATLPSPPVETDG